MIDLAKSAAALSRPGIDPRKFVDLGVVTAVDVTGEGVHVDVITSEGLNETAAVSQPYAGPGYGLHLPVDLDRPVVLAIPDGRWNAGARVVGSLWDEGDPPPQDVIDHREDVVLVVKPGKALRLIVSDGASVVIDARGGGKVLFGGDDAGDPVMRKSDTDAIVSKLNHLIVLYNAHGHAGGGTSPPPTLETPLLAPVGSSLTFTK